MTEEAVSEVVEGKAARTEAQAFTVLAEGQEVDMVRATDEAMRVVAEVHEAAIRTVEVAVITDRARVLVTAAINHRLRTPLRSKHTSTLPS